MAVGWNTATDVLRSATTARRGRLTVVGTDAAAAVGTAALAGTIRSTATRPLQTISATAIAGAADLAGAGRLTETMAVVADVLRSRAGTPAQAAAAIAHAAGDADAVGGRTVALVGCGVTDVIGVQTRTKTRPAATVASTANRADTTGSAAPGT